MMNIFAIIQKCRYALYLLCLLTLCTFLSAASTAFTQFQQDADILRLRHLQYYNDIIEKYHKIKGHYPFQNSDPEMPVYVFIANKNQQKFIRPGPPFAHIQIPFKKFVTEIEKATGKEMDELYDPQQTPEKKPNFYIYMVWGDKYALTVHLHKEYPFSKRKAAGYNRVTVSNQSNALTQSILPRRLFGNTVYRKVTETKIDNRKLFDTLEKKYLHQSKTEENNH